MMLHEALDEQRWFIRRFWRGNRVFEPWAFRWDRGRGQLLMAPLDDLGNATIADRRFGPSDVLAIDWEFLR
jgi:hypothetical protein